MSPPIRIRENLKVVYPPLHGHLVWDYKNADIPSIVRSFNRAVDTFERDD